MVEDTIRVAVAEEVIAIFVIVGEFEVVPELNSDE